MISKNLACNRTMMVYVGCYIQVKWANIFNTRMLATCPGCHIMLEWALILNVWILTVFQGYPWIPIAWRQQYWRESGEECLKLRNCTCKIELYGEMNNSSLFQHQFACADLHRYLWISLILTEMHRYPWMFIGINENLSIILIPADFHVFL